MFDEPFYETYPSYITRTDGSERHHIIKEDAEHTMKH